MHTLLDGLQRWNSEIRPRHAPTLRKLADSQSPHTLFITCVDSRIQANTLTDSGPGDLFVIRNIANCCPPDGEHTDPSAPAAVAYAVELLGVKDIVVCGHSGCGGIRAVLDPPPANAHLNRWLDNVRPALRVWHDEGPLDPDCAPADQLSQSSTLLQLKNLMTYPAVRSRVEARQLTLHAWWFDIGAGGRVLRYRPEAGKFLGDAEANARTQGNAA